MHLHQLLNQLQPKPLRRVAVLKRFESGAWKAQTPRGVWVELLGQGEVEQSVFYDAKTRRILEPAPEIEVWHEMAV